MMEKLLRKSWGVLIIAVMFATAVSAQDLALLERNAENSGTQPGTKMQTNSDNFQDRQVTGTVLSADNDEGLPGVNVVVKGTTSGGITGIDGTYAVNIPDDNSTLIFSSVGYVTEEVVVGNQSVIDLTLMPDITALDEIVVIGYGTSKKKDLTGSIVSVKAEEVAKYKPTSVSEILRSTAAGIQVGYSTSAKGIPDFEVRGDASIKADDGDERSANQPLVVVDGVIFRGNLSEINPNDVESVDVLKDASAAAIYGSQASNGVVIFTTKKGQLGKPRISVSTRVGLVTRGKNIQTHEGGEPVLNWLTDMNEAVTQTDVDPWSKFENYNDVASQYQPDWLTANGIPGATDPDVITNAWINNFGFWQNEVENFMAGNVYDWDDFLFQTGVRQDYDVSISGRSDKVSYYYSLGYSDRESVQVWDSYKTITSRLNLDVAVADFISVGVNASFAYEDEGQESVSNSGYYVFSPYDQPWENDSPFTAPWDEDISETRPYLTGQSAGSNRSNPFQNPAWNTRQHDRIMFNPTVYTKITLPLGLSLRVDYTPRFESRKRFDFEDSGNPGLQVDEARRRHNEELQWQLNNILNWEKTFGEHRLSATALYNAERNQQWYTNAENSNFSPTAALGYHGMGFGLNPSVSSSDEANSRTGVMGRINYAYGDRYNFSASIRRDGYSRFGAENLYGDFPSLSAAWTLTNESFMAGAPSWVNYLKLRASWGINGNSSGLDQYNAYAQLSNSLYLNYDGGYQATPYVSINRMANILLSWERSEAYNFAIDFGLMDNRLSGSLDVYTSETKDLLLDQKLPEVTGFQTTKTNIGNLRNYGFDLGLKGTILSSSEFIWTSTLNVTYKQNRITTLGAEPIPVIDSEGNPVLDGGGNPVLEDPDDIGNGWFIGENKDEIWDWELDGVYQLGEETEAAVYGLYPGDFRVVDQDLDGDIDTDDKVFLGLRENPYYITFRNDVEYKGFDLGLVFLAKLGYLAGTNQPFNNNQTYIKNHNWYDIPYWTPNNPIDDAARINSISFGNQVYTDKSYLRLQNVSIGYTLPEGVIEKMNLDRVRLALNIENAAVWSGWIYGDPEDWREMPTTYSFSLDFNF